MLKIEYINTPLRRWFTFLLRYIPTEGTQFRISSPLVESIHMNAVKSAINISLLDKDMTERGELSTPSTRPQSTLQRLADGLNLYAPDDLINVFLAHARRANFKNPSGVGGRHISVEMLKAIARSTYH